MMTMVLIENITMTTINSYDDNYQERIWNVKLQSLKKWV